MQMAEYTLKNQLCDYTQVIVQLTIYYVAGYVHVHIVGYMYNIYIYIYIYIIIYNIYIYIYSTYISKSFKVNSMILFIS